MVEIARRSRLNFRHSMPVFRSFLAIFFIVFLFGCAAKKTDTIPAPTDGHTVAEPKPAPKPAPQFVHVVKYSGETLSIISQWYTGNMNNWEAVAKANPSLSPNQITIDDRVVIPQDLLKNKKPMPLSFVQEFAPKPKPALKKKADPPTPAKKETQTQKTDSGSSTEAKTPAVKPPPAKSAPASQPPPVIFGPKDY